MKIFTEKKYNTITKYVIFIIIITLLMILTIFKFNSLLSILSKFFKVLTPIIWGLVIAYLLNPIMNLFEKLIKRFLFRKKPHNKASRRISVFLTAVITVSAITYLIYMLVPEITSSITAIPAKSEHGLKNLQDWANDFLKSYPSVNEFIDEQLISLDGYATEIGTSVTSAVSEYVPEVSKGIIHVIISLKDFVLGFIVSIYLLLSKETLISQTKKIFFAMFSKKTCERSIIFYHNSNKMFSGFIIGKIIDSIIIGILAFIIMSIIDMPYVILISVIIGVTNIIPFFGPFIGAIPSAFLILIDKPTKVIPFIIFIILLQQFDGNILGPKILGNSTGLPAFWVLFAILVGGGLFGFPGMLLGVPTFAVIYAVFRTYIETKLKYKKLPISTNDYKGDVSHLYQVMRAKDMKPNNTNSKVKNKMQSNYDKILNESPLPKKQK